MAKRVNLWGEAAVNENESSGEMMETRAASLAKSNPLEKAKIALEKYAKKIDAYMLDVKQIDVKDEGSAALMTSKLGLVRQAYKAIDEERKMIIADADKFVRTVNRWAKDLKDRLDMVLKIGEPKLKEYTYRLELARREEEKRLQEELNKRQAAMDRAARKAGVEPVKLPDAVTVQEKAKITTNEGSVSYRAVWVGIVVDPDLVPREYCSPDQKKIDAAVAGGIRNIAGVEIREEMRPTWRVR